MKLSKLNSDQLVYVNTDDYRIDWDKQVSKPQKKVKDILKSIWEFDAVYEELFIPGSKKRIDLLNYTKKIVVEVSPSSTHEKFNSFMHGSRSGFLKTQQTDNKKLEWAHKNGFTFIKLNDFDIKNISVDYFLAKVKLAENEENIQDP